MEFAVTMGMDAFRVCIGLKPRNHAVEEIVRWMRASSALSTPPAGAEGEKPR